MPLQFSQSKQGLERFTDPAMGQPVAFRQADVRVPVLAAGVELVGISGILVQSGKTAECPALSRCSVSVFNPEVADRVAVRPAVPPPCTFQLFGSIGGQWVLLKGFTWVAANWLDPGVMFWTGPLVEGFALAGRVDSGVGVVELRVGIRWLADRVSGPLPGDAGGGPGVTVK